MPQEMTPASSYLGCFKKGFGYFEELNYEISCCCSSNSSSSYNNSSSSYNNSSSNNNNSSSSNNHSYTASTLTEMRIPPVATRAKTKKARLR